MLNLNMAIRIFNLKSFENIDKFDMSSALNTGMKRVISWGGALAYIHVLSSISKALQIQPLTWILLMWNYCLYHRCSFQKATLFIGQLWIHTLFTHLWHIPSLNIDPNTDFFYCFLPIHWILWPLVRSVRQCFQYGNPTLSLFFCMQMTACLARVPPPGYKCYLYIFRSLILPQLDHVSIGLSP